MQINKVNNIPSVLTKLYVSFVLLESVGVFFFFFLLTLLIKKKKMKKKCSCNVMCELPFFFQTTNMTQGQKRKTYGR